MNPWIVIILMMFMAFEHIVVFFVFVSNKKWNIPVVILRYTGNKERPLLILRKARKKIVDGVPKLHVRGYKTPIRDYLANNYYPTVRSEHGGLILWEYEDGLLTPAVPKKELKKLTEQERALISRYEDTIKKCTSITFSFDENLYSELRLKAVDDTDIEGMVYELARTDRQYLPGWGRFLQQAGPVIGLLLVSVVIIVGMFLFFKNAPELAAQCAQAAVQNSQAVIEQVSQMASAPPA